MMKATDYQALLGQPRRLKMGNKPVWECQECGRTMAAFPIVDKHRECSCGSTEFFRHASQREHNRWHELKQLEKAGQIRNLRRQVSYRLEVNGKLICRYVADAVYEEKRAPAESPIKSWWFVCEDSKGYATREYKIKKALMEAIHGIEIRET